MLLCGICDAGTVARRMSCQPAGAARLRICEYAATDGVRRGSKGGLYTSEGRHIGVAEERHPCIRTHSGVQWDTVGVGLQAEQHAMLQDVSGYWQVPDIPGYRRLALETRMDHTSGLVRMDRGCHQRLETDKAVKS